MKYFVGLISLAVVLTTAIARAESSSAALKFFETDVRPLLVQRCVKCHGPKKAEAGLRLDSIAAILKGGESGLALVQGKPDQSRLMQAVRHLDGLEMPPDEKLADREIAALARWIKTGAVWPEGMTLGGDGPRLRSGPVTDDERAFWAFQKITDPPLPKVDVSLRVRNGVDRFIHRKLSDAGLRTRPPAAKRVLIRRATYDLTGLPPTPDQINAFLADDSPDAFQRVVDQLLELQQYGERWGRHWLDVVRYADTAGETGDYPTPLSYKYRNWVINAFNRDMPYDAFIRQQIAGDILARQRPDVTPERYREMLTATGFVAISRRFGFDVENYHNLTIQDTLDTIGQSVLGLSIGCARCHDHKYDPVSTNDYYAWYGILESTRYSFPGSEEKKRPYDSIPAIPPGPAAQRKADYAARLAKLDADIKQLAAEKQQHEARLKAGGTWLTYIESRRLPHPVSNRDGHSGFHVWHSAPLPIVGVNTSDAILKVPGTVPPKKFVVHPNPKEGVGVAWKSPLAGRVRITGKVHDAHDCGDSVAWHLDHLDATGFRQIAAGAIDKNSTQEFSAATKPIEVKVNQGDFIQLAVMPKTHYGCDLTQVEFTIAHEARDDQFWDVVADVGEDLLEGNPNDDRYGNADVWYFYRVAEDRGQAFGATPRKRLTAAEIATLEVAVENASTKLTQLSAERAAMKKSGPYDLIYGAIDGDNPQDARVQIRGDKRKLGDVVPRKNLEILGDDRLAANAGSGRLALAQWLTRTGNPLAARVMVNRIWQQHYGRGIVATENDFGIRGERPSHPELLDWLATRFVESGWSVKAMHRLIMNSATYQQSSEYDPIAAESDPDARLLWRFNRRRLSAEEIRDAMLLVSGDLDTTMGGEHPFPPVESWGFTQHAPYYGIYPTRRRSVYLMQQRLKRHPFLSLFDGADTNVSTARRSLTTVPTQALYLMNNEFVHERSLSLAKRLLTEPDVRRRVVTAFEMTLGREPGPSEQQSAALFVAAYREALDEKQDTAELAAWAGFTRTLLTRNEFLFLD